MVKTINAVITVKKQENGNLRNFGFGDRSRNEKRTI